ncbi:uncharacterized protein TNCV_4960311 [Trichonephila clavipes]|uniref:Uncharacterized protein n=1 Tax=Trichonephila clavipes TaxID=2585209 RepID=A0A8X6SHY3_TRICX|nr:uncharacterized protein TNCV_4960311 [Trichonephila clavipes]
MMLQDEVGISVGCLMLMLDWRNWRNSEIVRRPSNGRNVIIGVTTKMADKEISVSTAGIDFRRMIEDLTIRDTSLEMGVKRTNLVEGISEIKVRVRILVEVITAQGAKCQNVGIVELNVRIREFEKPWLFPVLADLEYPCILGVDFISGSKIILEFDRKSLVILDSQIDTVIKTIEEGNTEIDLPKARLEEKQKQELRDLFDSFKGLFSDKAYTCFIS